MIYVMSDLHGLKDKYDAAIEALNLQAEDTLYILGDVIDRGENGIAILSDIMKHPNFKMILGNHEIMMMDALKALAAAEKDPSFTNVDWFRKKEEHWMYHNGGFVTYLQFKKLTQSKQKEILAYLESLPIAYPDIEVNGRHYYLAHASFARKLPVNYEKPIYRRDVDQDDLRNIIWDRFVGRTFIKAYGHPLVLEGKQIIFGHTPTIYFKNCDVESGKCGIVKKPQFIAIDCGCAVGDERAQLGVLRLDDLKEFYF